SVKTVHIPGYTVRNERNGEAGMGLDNNKTRKKTIKVLFVYPNPMMDNLIPIGVSLLSSCLKQAGHQVKLFDTTFYDTGEPIGEYYREKNLQVIKTDFKDVGITREKDEEEMISDFRKMVDEYRPDLVAVSAIEISYLQGVKLLQSIVDYDVSKIMGGVHATFSPDEALREDSIDMICRGEGEDAIVELADKIAYGEDYSTILNIWSKKDGKIIKNELRPLKDLNTLPFQDWEIYDERRLYKPFLGSITVTAAIETSRGCPGKCSYCCNPVSQEMYRDKGRFFRIKDNVKVMEEINYLKKRYNINFIKIVDPDFLAKSRNQFLEFTELYKEIKIPFWAEARAGDITEEKVQLLEEIGCRGFAVGLESGNEYIRKEILDKNVSNKTIIEAFKILKKTNMKICANNMIGIPHEGRKEIFDTIRINKAINLDNPIVNIFNPYRGTPLRDLCVKEGYITEDSLAGDYRSETVLEMPQISKEELYGLQRTFPLYVKLPKVLYPLIKVAEKSDLVFQIFSKYYSWKYLSNKK
ncbi:B12-binding domain-containing radical SAM protein, partial [Elusimicrobiota bacterium]